MEEDPREINKGEMLEHMFIGFCGGILVGMVIGLFLQLMEDTRTLFVIGVMVWTVFLYYKKR